MELGIYWDRDASKTIDSMDAIAHRLNELNISHVAIMVNHQSVDDPDKRPDTFNDSLEWQTDQVARFVTLLGLYNISSSIVVWPFAYHSKTEQQAMFNYIDTILTMITNRTTNPGLKAIELDVEGFNWYNAHVHSNFYRLGTVGAYVVEGLRKLIESHSLNMELRGSTYPGAIAACVASLPGLDAWTIQAYSQWKEEKGPSYGWDGRYGPGHMQTLARKALYSVDPKTRFRCALAIYGQDHWDQFSHTRYEAMEKALKTAKDEGCTEFCYWSIGNLNKTREADFKRLSDSYFKTVVQTPKLSNKLMTLLKSLGII